MNSLSFHARVEVMNLNRADKKYIVARAINGELWFWGQWDDEDEARKVAEQFENGVVLEMEEG